MPVKKEKKPKKVTKSAKYVSALQTGVTKKQAMLLAGFSPNASSGSIDRLPSVRQALQSIEQQRDVLSQLPEFSFTDVAKRYVKRATSKSVSPRIQTDNDKAYCGIMGFNAPAQVNVKSVGLLMEFSDLTSADLAAIRDSISFE